MTRNGSSRAGTPTTVRRSGTSYTIRVFSSLSPSSRRSRSWDDASCDDDFNHGYTFAGHSVACAVALKNLEIMEQERLVPRVKEFSGPALMKLLAKFKDHPLVGEVRSVGLLGAIELVADKRNRRRFAEPGRVGLICRDHFFSEGFIMRAVFDTMVTASPLIRTQDHFDEAEEAIARALNLTLNDVAGELAA